MITFSMNVKLEGKKLFLHVTLNVLLHHRNKVHHFMILDIKVIEKKIIFGSKHILLHQKLHKLKRNIQIKSNQIKFFIEIKKAIHHFIVQISGSFKPLYKLRLTFRA